MPKRIEHLTRAKEAPANDNVLVAFVDNRSREFRSMTVGEIRRLHLYAHRNGETDTPTIDGAYWFKGERLHQWSSEDSCEWFEDAGSLLHCRDGEIEPYGGYWTCGDCIETDGQWWGPIVPPWEQAK